MYVIMNVFNDVPCGGGLKYLHRNPAKRRRKENPVPGGVNGPPCSWGYKNGTWPSRLGESQRRQ
jgi:hypothetical protein